MNNPKELLIADVHFMFERLRRALRARDSRECMRAGSDIGRLAEYANQFGMPAIAAIAIREHKQPEPTDEEIIEEQRRYDEELYRANEESFFFSKN